MKVNYLFLILVLFIFNSCKNKKTSTTELPPEVTTKMKVTDIFKKDSVTAFLAAHGEENAEISDKKIQDAIATEDIIAYNEPPSVSNASPMPNITEAPQASESYEKVIVEVDEVVAVKKDVASSKTHFFKTKIYDARGVKQTYEEVTKSEIAAIVKQESKKQIPLYVIDGESVANNKNKGAKDKLTVDDIENIVVLKEPLYIINGVEYSEESLFGVKPTSPYAPLDQQEIIKTVVFQGDEAIAIYGEKGRKGVVVVTTKNGKALKKL